MFALWLIGAAVSAVLSAFLAAIVFMLTSFAGLVLLGLFLLMFLGYLVSPEEDEMASVNKEGLRYEVRYMHNVLVQGNVRATRYAVLDTKTKKLVGKNRPPYYESSIDARRVADRMNKES